MRVNNACILFAGTCLASPVAEEQGSKHAKRDIQFVVNQERADAVKEAFSFAWDGYYKYAFPNDELLPVSNGYGNSRNGWGASAVDALSTAIIMELSDIVWNITRFVPTIDFGVTADQVSVFETTIRYLGGMLSGYDLLKGPFSLLDVPAEDVDGLLAQSRNLAEKLSPAFKTATGIPDNNINITTGSLETTDQSTGLAVAGTLVMEWTRLSDLTGDPMYAQLAQDAEKYLLNPEYTPPFEEPWPGLEGTGINYTTGLFTDAAGGWVGGADSFYEYLIKMFVYDKEKYGLYRDRWIAAADSSIQYLKSHPNTRPYVTFMAAYENRTLVYTSQHLACFDGGNFLLGGMVLGEQKYLDYGLELTAGCHETYIQDSTRIGPEIFGWVPSTCGNINVTSAYSMQPLGIRNNAPVQAPPKKEGVTRPKPSPTLTMFRVSEASASADDYIPPYEYDEEYGYNGEDYCETTQTCSEEPTTTPTPTPTPTTWTTTWTETWSTTMTVTSSSTTETIIETITETLTETLTGTVTTTATETSTPTPDPCMLPAEFIDQAEFYAKSGFFIQTDSFNLRPEVMESYYYAYRITGDTKYQDWAWDAFLAINATARVGSGFSAFYGVNGPAIEYADNQESFFFAELMKYAYMIHSEDGPWQVNYKGGNEFVYNTEAHPFKAVNPANEVAPKAAAKKAAASAPGVVKGQRLSGVEERFETVS